MSNIPMKPLQNLVEEIYQKDIAFQLVFTEDELKQQIEMRRHRRFYQNRFQAKRKYIVAYKMVQGYGRYTRSIIHFPDVATTLRL